MGDYKRAELLYKRSLPITEKALGPEHPDTATSLANLARLYDSMGDYIRAEPLHKRALAIREKTLGPKHPDTTASLENLAGLYRSMGDFARAEPLSQRALVIREKALGPDHPDTAASLNILAGRYQAIGDFARALPLFKRALETCEKALGPEHPDTATSLTNLAVLYLSMGDYAQAEPLLKRALMISEKALGPDHPHTATSLTNLAVLYLYESMGDYIRAEPLLMRARVINEKVFGPEHPSTAAVLEILAGLYQSTGDYARAVPLHKQALAVIEKALGPDHYNTVSILNNLGSLYQSMDNLAQAEPLLKRALSNSEKAFGPENSYTIECIINLALEQGATNDNIEAFNLFQRGLEAENRAIANVFQVLTEAQKLKFVQKSPWGYQALLSLIHQKFPTDHTKVRAGLDAILSRKAIVYDAQSRQNEAIVASSDPEIKALWTNLASQRSMLAKQLQDGPGQATPETYRQRLEQLQAEIGKLESDLAAKSPLAAADLAQRKVTTERLAGLLPKDSVLVEFVKIRDVDWTKGKLTHKQRYLAFVLRPGQTVDLVDLGQADTLDTQGKALLEKLKQGESNAERGLYDLIWKPLAPRIGSATQVVISPDGLLNLIPFAALMDPNGKYLVESLEFSYVTSGRDLARTQPFQPEADLFLAANPDFNKANATPQPAPDPTPGKSRSGVFNGPFPQWPQLPGTETEFKQVPPLLEGPRKQAVSGADATETAVLSSRRPKVLHLATHGFFLPDQPALKPDTGPMGLDKTPALPKGYENPLIRSGLVFTGANHAQQAQTSNDGLLTALEVSGMDLHGTALVTLSACQTAEGDVSSGEGVYGLRRAFALSGAEHLMMSLWPVSDDITAQQMLRFYELFGQGTPASRALRQAHLETIAKLRKERGLAQPVLWAPFIMQGAPGKI